MLDGDSMAAENRFLSLCRIARNIMLSLVAEVGIQQRPCADISTDTGSTKSRPCYCKSLREVFWLPYNVSVRLRCRFSTTGYLKPLGGYTFNIGSSAEDGKPHFVALEPAHYKAGNSALIKLVSSLMVSTLPFVLSTHSL